MLGYWSLLLLLVVATVHCELEQNDYDGDAFDGDMKDDSHFDMKELNEDEEQDELLDEHENDETDDMLSSFNDDDDVIRREENDDENDETDDMLSSFNNDDDVTRREENDDENDETDDYQEDRSQVTETLDDASTENDMEESRRDKTEKKPKRFLWWIRRRLRRRQTRPPPPRRPCDSRPCRNGGSCRNVHGRYVCTCLPQYHGNVCQYLRQKPCASNPCQNGGKCTNVQYTTFQCTCTKHYKGNRCETPKDPCYKNPCLNGGECHSEGDSFYCICAAGFVGKTCEKELENPCKPNPCQNEGKCTLLAGTKFTCTCKPEFGGRLCEHPESECSASGDPHYTSFDKRRFDFMGKCDYVFASDCSNGAERSFAVYTKNVACGRSASCVAAVRIELLGHDIKFTRQKSVVIVDNVLYTKFPFTRRGFTITNPSGTWLRLVSDIGLTVSWNGHTYITVKVSGKYKDKMCGLCGNNNGDPSDDNLDASKVKCIPPPAPECVATVEKKAIMDKCDLMASSPFSSCNSVVDPKNAVENCKYDACRCDTPMECVCNAFAAYTKSCAAYGEIIDWRFKGTFLVGELAACEKTCKTEEVFTECGSSVAETCDDLSRPITSSTECIAGCQCPEGEVLKRKGVCIPKADCYCKYGYENIPSGKTIDVSKCVSCTCSSGVLECFKDDKCVAGPCDSSPCENHGVCKPVGDNDFTCDCDCKAGFTGKTCNESIPEPCDSQPCQNGGTCTNMDDGYECLCAPGYVGEDCKDVKCHDVKLDLAYVVDSSGSLKLSGFRKLKKFLKDLNKRFDIRKKATNVGIVEFSKDVNLVLKFAEGTTRASVNKAITNMKHLNSFTYTSSALKMAREKLFASERSERCAAKVLILLTDGKASVSIDPNETKPEKEAALLKKSGVTIVTVGIGDEETVDEFRDELTNIASKSETTGKKLFYEGTLDSLNKIANELVKQSCGAQAICT